MNDGEFHSEGAWAPDRSRIPRQIAAFLVKLIHSLLFLTIAASIAHIFYAGVTNRASRLTVLALVVSTTEVAVFAGNGWRCPLRLLAENLGAESGQVTDIFLPKWFADRIPFIFTPPLVFGVIGLIWNARRQRPLDAGSS